MKDKDSEKDSQGLLDRLKITRVKVKNGLFILSSILLIGSVVYWYIIGQRIYSDKAEIVAPLILLSPVAPSILEDVLVKNGQQIFAHQAVAKLGGQILRAETDGEVVAISDQIGKLFSPGMPVITMIHPDDLRLVVHVAENKGFTSIHVGQEVKFQVDAFGSEYFTGVVEEISQISDQSSVVFSISDKRDEKYFSIKVKYSDSPELLNGMSAKAWIYK